MTRPGLMVVELMKRKLKMFMHGTLRTPESACTAKMRCQAIYVLPCGEYFGSEEKQCHLRDLRVLKDL